MNISNWKNLTLDIVGCIRDIRAFNFGTQSLSSVPLPDLEILELGAGNKLYLSPYKK